MSKHIAILALGLLASAASHAVPAKRIKTAVKQPDGTSLIITVRGDEHFHFTSTEDGMPLVQATDGAYCYALLDNDGRLAPSSQIAHSPSARSALELGFLRTYTSQAEKVKQIGTERRAARNASRIARLQKRAPHKMVGAGGGEGIGVTGKRKGLVILVNFQDTKMMRTHTQAEWNDYFNLKGYSKLNNSGSVHDYFYNQSYGLFDLEFDVVGPVTVSKKMAAYGANDAYGNDVDPAGMVYEACQLAADQVNFSDYDWDGDGEADQVYLIYAGYGEAANSNTLANTIWQHEWNLEEARDTASPSTVSESTPTDVPQSLTATWEDPWTASAQHAMSLAIASAYLTSTTPPATAITAWTNGTSWTTDRTPATDIAP